MNSVDDLLKNPFQSRPLQQKLEVIALGRPMPNLELSQSKPGRNRCPYNRFFKPRLYKEVSWMCGCPIRNAMFCFPCLLFSGDTSWSTKGITDLWHLKDNVRKHSESMNHILNVLNLVDSRGVNIKTQLQPSYHLSLRKYNSLVENNRDVLSKFIDCINFCAIHGLPLSSPKRGDTSKNPGVLRGLMDFISNLDTCVRNHLESSNIFKDSCETIQRLLDCILGVCREEIMNEIKTTRYIAIVIDSVTDVSGKTQLPLIIRYINGSRIHERFWGFLHPKSFDVAGISECILQEIQQLVKNKTLVSQSYSGLDFMCGATNSVQARISEVYPDACYVHSYMHTIPEIVRECASKKRGVRTFFSVLESAVTFFSSSKYIVALQEKEHEFNLETSPINWDFENHALNLVRDHHKILILCLEKLEADSSLRTEQQAHVLGINLRKSDFIFWLEFFYRVMPHVDILFQLVQSQGVTSKKIKEAVEFFVHIVQKLKGDLDTILCCNDSESFVTPKRLKYEDTKLADAEEVIDMITFQVKERFQFLEYYDIARLIDCRYFRAHFNDSDLDKVEKLYASVNKKNLKTQLLALYERNEFYKMKGTTPLLNLIVQNDIQDTFSEVLALLEIFLTMPGLTSDPERCFSTPKRIRTFLRNHNCEVHYNAGGMLSVEEDMVKNIKHFNSRVIEKFVSLEGCGKEFLYKK